MGLLQDQRLTSDQEGSRRGHEKLPGGDRVVPQEVRRLLDGSGRGGQRAHEARPSEGSVPRPAGTVKSRLTAANRVIHHPPFNVAPGLVDDPFLRPLCRGGRCLPQDPLSAGIARIELKEARGPKGGREGGECRNLRKISQQCLQPLTTSRLNPMKVLNWTTRGTPGRV